MQKPLVDAEKEKNVMDRPTNRWTKQGVEFGNTRLKKHKQSNVTDLFIRTLFIGYQW